MAYDTATDAPEPSTPDLIMEAIATAQRLHVETPPLIGALIALRTMPSAGAFRQLTLEAIQKHVEHKDAHTRAIMALLARFQAEAS